MSRRYPPEFHRIEQFVGTRKQRRQAVDLEQPSLSGENHPSLGEIPTFGRQHVRPLVRSSEQWKCSKSDGSQTPCSPGPPSGEVGWLWTGAGDWPLPFLSLSDLWWILREQIRQCHAPSSQPQTAGGLTAGVRSVASV